MGADFAQAPVFYQRPPRFQKIAITRISSMQMWCGGRYIAMGGTRPSLSNHRAEIPVTHAIVILFQFGRVQGAGAGGESGDDDDSACAIPDVDMRISSRSRRWPLCELTAEGMV